MGYTKQPFTVSYLTPYGNCIDLPVPDFPNDPQLRAQLSDQENRPGWARVYLDETYREYRLLDNRRRSDITIDNGQCGADYFEAPAQPFSQVASRPFTDEVEDHQVVVELLSTLPARQREFIMLHVIHGDRFTEIAADQTTAGHATTPDAVRKMVKRGLALLREQLS